MDLPLSIPIHVLKELIIFLLFLVWIVSAQVVWLLVLTLGIDIMVLAVVPAMVCAIVSIEEARSIEGLIPVPFVGILFVG